MREPNNLRNRYRRYRAAMKAYGFYGLDFRSWFRSAAPNSYCAPAREVTPGDVIRIRGVRCTVIDIAPAADGRYRLRLQSADHPGVEITDSFLLSELI